jgi:hypothetical protein
VLFLDLFRRIKSPSPPQAAYSSSLELPRVLGDQPRRARSRSERTFPMQDTLGGSGSGTAALGARPPPPVLAFLGKMAGGWLCCRRAPWPPSFPGRPMMGAVVGLSLPEKHREEM